MANTTKKPSLRSLQILVKKLETEKFECFVENDNLKREVGYLKTERNAYEHDSIKLRAEVERLDSQLLHAKLDRAICITALVEIGNSNNLAQMGKIANEVTESIMSITKAPESRISPIDNVMQSTTNGRN